MEKLIQLVICMFFMSSVCAQIEKGTYMLGGSTNASILLRDGSNTIDVNIEPRLGYFINNSLAIGSLLEVSLNMRSDAYSSTIFGLSPFARYYFGKSEHSSFFTTLSIGFIMLHSNNDNTRAGYNGKYDIGIVHFLNPSIGLQTSLRYSYNKYSDFKIV